MEPMGILQLPQNPSQTMEAPTVKLLKQVERDRTTKGHRFRV